MDLIYIFSRILLVFNITTYTTTSEQWNNNELLSYFFDAIKQYNRTEADSACTDRGGILAMPKDNQSHQFVYDILPTKNVANGMQAFHIGFKRGSDPCGCNDDVYVPDCAACRRTWRWADGTPLTDDDRRWERNMPWVEQGRDCGVENTWKGYSAVFCNSDRGVICQYHCNTIGCHQKDCKFISGVYNCQCDSGYTGQHCDLDLDECASNPCQNAFTCINNYNAFYCNCTSGYTGVTCETEINECLSNPCQNSGTCRDIVNHYICDCPNGFTGTHCETEIDECESKPCQNGGSCLDLIGTYNFTCADQYTAVTCEKDLQTDVTSLDTQNVNKLKDAVIGLSVAFVLVTIIAVVTSLQMFRFWRRIHGANKKPGDKVIDAIEPYMRHQPESTTKPEDVIAMYESAQSISDVYQNTYQVLSS